MLPEADERGSRARCNVLDTLFGSAMIPRGFAATAGSGGMCNGKRRGRREGHGGMPRFGVAVGVDDS